MNQKPRSPLAERVAPISPDQPSLCNSNGLLSSSSNVNVPLPPLKLYSSVIGPIPSLIADFHDEDESIASAPSVVNLSCSDSVEEELLGSSDSEFGNTEVQSYSKRSTLARGVAWENLKVEIPVNSGRNEIDELCSRVRYSFIR